VPTGASDIAVYCSSGGAAALTADIIGQYGVGLASFSDDTKQTLSAALPHYAAIGNPVDTTTAILSNAKLVDETLLAVCRDPNVALVVLPITIDYGVTTERIADSAVRVQALSPVPILPIWMTDRIGTSFPTYGNAGLVPSKSVGKAVKAIRRWIDHGLWRQKAHRLDWTPWPTLGQPVPEGGKPLALSERDAKAWLAKHGVPILRSALATGRAEAMKQAAAIGFPVVLKVASADITHKSDVGGVRVGLNDADAVGRAWDGIHDAVRTAMPNARIDGLLVEAMATGGLAEVLVGVSRDPVFGHVLTFGLGGVYVEVFKDVSRRLLPLQCEEADAMVREVRSFALLDGARGRPKADVAALVDLLMHVSDFVGAHAESIDEIDLNPVWVGAVGQGVQALDAVIVGREPAKGFA
jgi:acetate---CoA ligase (ADP-forming)